MIESKKRWLIQRPDQDVIEQLANELNIPVISAKVLASRGLTDPEAARYFIHMDENSLHDPYLMKDMDVAVRMIKHSIMEGERILIYGDYDADGVTSVSVLLTAMTELGAHVDFMIPNRFTDGYGPSERLFRIAHEKGTKLLITVDNGISGLAEVELAKKLGMKVIVTDHHEPGEELPKADAVIHPRHPEGNYPFGELAGVGVALKLAHALYGEVPNHLFELAAIGTIADLVPLQGENRYIVKEGLKRLRKTERLAIRAMCKVSGVEQKEITEETIGFAFGPRINAVGRLGDADPAVTLFLTDDPIEAASLAKLLDDKNKERQSIVSTITEEAEALIDPNEIEAEPTVIVVAKEGWNPGVVGIVASRLVEKYYRPAIVLSIDPETGNAKGSARSIEGFHLYNELDKNREILPHFGGHPMAAGMTLKSDHVDELRRRLDTQAKECLQKDDLIPVLNVDIPISINDIDLESIESLRELEPFGIDFPKPKYLIEDVFVSTSRKIGAAQNHAKMELFDGTSSVDAVGFGHGELIDQLTPGIKISLVGDLSINEWNGRKKPQFMIEDARSKEWQLFDIRGIRQVDRWLHTIPESETIFFAFEQETVQFFRHLIKKEIRLHSTEDSFTCENIVLLDLPSDLNMMEKMISTIKPKRVYAHFYVAESRFFGGLPTREQFSWYYAFLKKRESFDIRKNANELAKHKGWSRELIFFMSKVFLELDFVKINNGLAEINHTPIKRDLSEAPSYKQREQQIRMEQLLLYAPYMELKTWFDGLLDGQTSEEEIAWI
ncbi:single-stranded-DNA-specific exonuclease RecJ [Chungangia koreensis]|uniref:Single-stranded-DNA-specific exonuclease RecJ n=1 Tax=Chungangia koreensis TaxID=752657 RepID=A0ABV8X1Z0_9LACT